MKSFASPGAIAAVQVPIVPAPIRREDAVLRPFHLPETLSAREAAILAGVSIPTIRLWITRFSIGRRIGGKLLVSKVALGMHLDGDRDALKSYLAGDRHSPAVRVYFERHGINVDAVFRTPDKGAA